MSTDFIELVLHSKRRIHAECVHLARTYEGLLEGKPNAQINADVVRDIPKEMRRIFGDFPVVIQTPKIVRTEEEHPMLSGQKRIIETMPSLMIAARFVSYTPVKNEDASGLIIVWFQKATTPFMDEEVRQWVEKLDWNYKAKDFSW